MKALRYFKQLSLMVMLVVASAFFANCEGDADVDEGATPALTVSVDGLYFTTIGEEQSIRIKTEGYWEIFADDDFSQLATFDITDGEGEAKVTLTVVEGEDLEDEFTISAVGADPITIKVTRAIEAQRFSIYHETMGSATQGKPYPFVVQYNESESWGTYLNGTSPADDLAGDADATDDDDATTVPIPDYVKGVVKSVSYIGEGVNFYKTGYSNLNPYGVPAYEKASGINAAVFSLEGSELITKVEFESDKAPATMELNFGVCYQKKTVNEETEEEFWDTTFKPEVMTVELGIDDGVDIKWTEVEYTTIGGGFDENYWSLVSSKFTLAATTNILYVRIKANDINVIRVDDIALYNDADAAEGAVSVDLSTGEVDPEEVVGDPEADATPISISDLLALKQIILDDEEGISRFFVDAETDRYFEGIVVNDPVGYNFFSNAMILVAPNEDGTATSTEPNSGITITGALQSTYANEYKVGDKIRVTLRANKARYSLADGSFRLVGDATIDWAKFEKLSSGNTINKIALTNDDYATAAQYEAMPVVFSGVDTPLNEDNEPCQDGVWGSKTTSIHTVNLFSFAAERKPSETNLPVYVVGGKTDFAEKAFIRDDKSGDGVDLSGLIAIYKDQTVLMPSTSDDVATFTSTDPEYDPRTISISDLNAMFDKMGTPDGADLTLRLGKEIVVKGVMMNDIDGKNIMAANYRTALLTENDTKDGVINQPGYGIAITTGGGKIYCKEDDIKHGEVVKIIISDPILTISKAGERHLNAGNYGSATTCEKLERPAPYVVEPIVLDAITLDKVSSYIGCLVQVTGMCTSTASAGKVDGTFGRPTITSDKATTLQMVNGTSIAIKAYKGEGQLLLNEVEAKIDAIYQVTGFVVNNFVVPRRPSDIVSGVEMPELPFEGSPMSIPQLVEIAKAKSAGLYEVLPGPRYIENVVRTSVFNKGNFLNAQAMFQDKSSKAPNNGFVVMNLNGNIPLYKEAAGVTYDIQLSAGAQIGKNPDGGYVILYDADNVQFIKTTDPVQLIEPVVLTDVTNGTLQDYQHMLVKIEGAVVDVDDEYLDSYTYKTLAHATTGSEMRMLPATHPTTNEEFKVQFKGLSAAFKTLNFLPSATGDVVGIVNYSYNETSVWAKGFSIIPRDEADVQFLIAQ